MVSHSVYDKPVYSLYVEDKSRLICSCGFYISGHPVYIMTYPCLNLELYGSSASFVSQLTAEYASTYTYIF